MRPLPGQDPLPTPPFPLPWRTVDEAAEAWGLSASWLRRLCQQGRVVGAQKRGGTWFIPANAPPPERRAYARPGQSTPE